MEALKTPYSDNFDALLATVTYLGVADFGRFQGRSLEKIVQGVGPAFAEAQISNVLLGFPGLIRRTEDGYYNLQLRFAHRQKRGEEYHSPPLESEEFSILFDLIAKMVAHEKESSKLFIEQHNAIERLSIDHKHALDRLSRDIEQRDRARRWTLIASLIAAAASIFVAAIAARATMSAALVSGILKGH